MARGNEIVTGDVLYIESCYFIVTQCFSHVFTTHTHDPTRYAFSSILFRSFKNKSFVDLLPSYPIRCGASAAFGRFLLGLCWFAGQYFCERLFQATIQEIH